MADPGTCAICGRNAIHAVGDRCYRHRRPANAGDSPRPKSRHHAVCGQGGCRNVPAPGCTTCEQCRERNTEAKRRAAQGAKIARDYLTEQWARNGAAPTSPPRNFSVRCESCVRTLG